MKTLTLMIVLVCCFVSFEIIASESTNPNQTPNRYRQQSEDRRNSREKLGDNLQAWRESTKEFVNKKYPLKFQPK